MSVLAGDQTLWEAREKGSPVRWLIQVSPQAQNGKGGEWLWDSKWKMPSVGVSSEDVLSRGWRRGHLGGGHRKRAEVAALGPSDI